MKQFAIICSIIVAIMIYITAFRTQTVQIKGKIIEKYATPDKYGHLHYHILAEFEDGRYRELEGMKYYVQPVNSTVVYETTVFNFE